MAVKCVLKSIGGAQKESGILYPVVVNYSRIRASDFVDMMEENCGVKRAQILSVLAALAEQACQMIEVGHSVEVPYFGTLSMAMKGRGETDEEGKAQLTDARFWKLRIKPCAAVRDRLRMTDFKLATHRVLSGTSVSIEAAKEACQKLCDEKGVFGIGDFQSEAHVSYGTAQRILKQLEDEGFLALRIIGKQKIYSLAEEKQEVLPTQQEQSGDNAG